MDNKKKLDHGSNAKVSRIAAVSIIPFKHTVYYINVLLIFHVVFMVVAVPESLHFYINIKQTAI